MTTRSPTGHLAPLLHEGHRRERATDEEATHPREPVRPVTVDLARTLSAHGIAWSVIGKAAGLIRQGARQRWRRMEEQ